MTDFQHDTLTTIRALERSLLRDAESDAERESIHAGAAHAAGTCGDDCEFCADAFDPARLGRYGYGRPARQSFDRLPF